MPKPKKTKKPSRSSVDRCKDNAAQQSLGLADAPLKRLAHELKTPISAIAAAADVMCREEFGAIENDKYKNYVTDIHASAILSLAIIDRMMDAQLHYRSDAAGSSQTPRGQFCKTEIDAPALLKSIVSSLQPLARNAGIELGVANSKHGKRETLRVRADEISLTQILLNLTNNAIKFTPARGQVVLGTTKNDNGSIAITVSDTGIGMTDEQIANALAGRSVPQISNQPLGRGLGIGLPIVHALCKANGTMLNLSPRDNEPGTLAQVIFPPEVPGRV